MDVRQVRFEFEQAHALGDIIAVIAEAAHDPGGVLVIGDRQPPSPPVVQCLLWQKLKAPAWPMAPTFFPLYVPPCAWAQSSITISLCSGRWP